MRKDWHDMSCARRLVAVLLLFSCHAQVRAQFIAAPYPGYGFGFSYHHHHHHNRFWGLSGYYGYPGFGYGYRYPLVNVTYLYSPPPVISAPPIIINNNVNVGDRQAAEEPDIMRDERFLAIRPRKGKIEAEPAERAPKAMPGEAAGGFRKVDPKERVRPEAPAAKKPAPEPAPKERPKPERPADTPEEEAERQIGMGRRAFEAMGYGLAERRFEQALRANPKEAQAYFLLAQAQFALGKYREAVESIEAGLRLQPDWPGARFRSREPYAGNNDEFDDHLKRLLETLERHPNDFYLLFLNAYQLWFDGKQDEARVLFGKALKAAPAQQRGFVNRFLLHGQPVVQR
jgi:tetratricopeptide (TPR) repeat protein